MLITNIEDFVKIIPTAAGTEWDAMEPFIFEAENQLIGLFLGEDLYQYFETSSGQMKSIANRLLCLQAYENAIPFVDLVQTPNGFAVISATNLLPASKERVEKLRAWVENQIYMNSDLLVQLIMSSVEALAEWTKFVNFKDLTDCLFYTGIDFARYATVEGTKRKTFMDNRNKLINWQVNVLEKVVSKVYLEKLIEALRTSTCTTGDFKVIRLCKMILGKMYDGQDTEADKLCNALANVLDSDLVTYTDYANSAEYALKSKPRYENRQEDNLFFFN